MAFKPRSGHSFPKLCDAGGRKTDPVHSVAWLSRNLVFRGASRRSACPATRATGRQVCLRHSHRVSESPIDEVQASQHVGGVTPISYQYVRTLIGVQGGELVSGGVDL